MIAYLCFVAGVLAVYFLMSTSIVSEHERLQQYQQRAAMAKNGRCTTGLRDGVWTSVFADASETMVRTPDGSSREPSLLESELAQRATADKFETTTPQHGRGKPARIYKTSTSQGEVVLVYMYL